MSPKRFQKYWRGSDLPPLGEGSQHGNAPKRGRLAIDRIRPGQRALHPTDMPLGIINNNCNTGLINFAGFPPLEASSPQRSVINTFKNLLRKSLKARKIGKVREYEKSI
ncbi:MAG: hypothetical protein J7J97_02835 [Thermococcus sp.]|nr:hypothetical protein [Thermococcus sp.]